LEFEPRARAMRAEALEKLARAMLPALLDLARAESMLEASRDPVETDRPGDLVAGVAGADVGQGCLAELGQVWCLPEGGARRTLPGRGGQGRPGPLWCRGRSPNGPYAL